MKVHVVAKTGDVVTADMVLDLPALLAFGPAALKALLEKPGSVVILSADR